MKKGNKMTPTEFKAWFDGFTEALAGLPNDDQWKRIKARVAEIDGKPISYPVYVDRYWSNPYRPYWYGGYCATSGGAGVVSSTFTGVSSTSTITSAGASTAPTFDSKVAMYALGKADANAA
jgi:hypothetical protein